MTDLTCCCGNTNLRPFGRRFLLCRECATLVGEDRPQGGSEARRQHNLDYYGPRYWTEHQQELGNPAIDVRTVSDLPERCSSWLATLLKYKLPPSKILDVGCAHGGFVALSQWAGFSSLGLELSPWTVQFARKTFGIPVLEGSLEEQSFEVGSLEAVMMMDLLEHLENPGSALAVCRRILNEEGLLIIQTPCFPEIDSFEELQESGSTFVRMMIPHEHLYLFSRRSMEQLCREAGFDHFIYEPPVFPYDMLLIASSKPISSLSLTEAIQALSLQSPGRLVLALLQGTGLIPSSGEQGET